MGVRCSECSSWSSEIMQDYLKHRKPLVSKGKKKPVSSAPPSSPSISPAGSTVASVGSSHPIPLVMMTRLRIMCTHSVLSSFFSRSGSLGVNPSSFSAPTMVPDSASQVRGVTGG